VRPATLRLHHKAEGRTQSVAALMTAASTKPAGAPIVMPGSKQDELVIEMLLSIKIHGCVGQRPRPHDQFGLCWLSHDGGEGRDQPTTLIFRSDSSSSRQRPPPRRAPSALARSTWRTASVLVLEQPIRRAPCVDQRPTPSHSSCGLWLLRRRPRKDCRRASYLSWMSYAARISVYSVRAYWTPRSE
jgi:hypothetical protein